MTNPRLVDIRTYPTGTIVRLCHEGTTFDNVVGMLVKIPGREEPDLVVLARQSKAPNGRMDPCHPADIGKRLGTKWKSFVEGGYRLGYYEITWTPKYPTGIYPGYET